MASAASAKDFLSAIWGESQGWAELTAIGKSGVQSFPFSYPDGLDSLIETAPRHNRDANIYFGICLRREKWPRPTGRKDAQGKPEIEFRGTEENVSSSWCVWVEFDFEADGHKGRVIPQELCRKFIKEFAFPPSIVVRSGGGVQVYWLFKEAVTGEDVWRVKAVNKALVTCFTVGAHGADPQSVDLARIFRVPGTLNVKYTPPRLCEISLWHPERRYTLDDFEGLLPVEAVQKPAAASPGEPASTPGRPAPSLRLEPEKIDELGNLFNQLWFEGHRHAMALRVAGMLAFSGVHLEDARAIVTLASDKAGGDTAKRLKDVEDTYQSFINGKEVVGAPSISKMIEEELPETVNKLKCRTAFKKIKNLLPKREKSGDKEDAKPDFEIVKLVKFDSAPARWTITLKVKEGEELQATCETKVLLNIKLFTENFFEQTHYMLKKITNTRWQRMFDGHPIDVKETPKEAKPQGAIENALEEFLNEARENPDIGLLKTLAGYDEASRFFKLAAFKDFMKEQGMRFEDRLVLEHLKQLGFKSGPKRVKDKVERLWVQSLNGNGHPNGEEPSKEPNVPVTPSTDLFL